MNNVMFWNRFIITSMLCAFSSGFAFSAECARTPAKEINLDLGSTRSLSSPDLSWRFESVGPNSPEQKATLYIQNTRSSKKWNVGSIERDGTVFWSEDSKRLFLRDEYAADDTKIRIFDVSGVRPKEIMGLDRRIRKAVFAHIPNSEMNIWLYYPQVCFAANDSSTIIVVANVPLAPKKGGAAKDFRLQLTANLYTLKVVTVGN
jgi:hypothetical protein